MGGSVAHVCATQWKRGGLKREVRFVAQCWEEVGQWNGDRGDGDHFSFGQATGGGSKGQGPPRGT